MTTVQSLLPSTTDTAHTGQRDSSMDKTHAVSSNTDLTSMPYTEQMSSTRSLICSKSALSAYFVCSKTFLSSLYQSHWDGRRATWKPYSQVMNDHRPAYNIPAIMNWQQDLSLNGSFSSNDKQSSAEAAHLRSLEVLAMMREEAEVELSCPHNAEGKNRSRMRRLQAIERDEGEVGLTQRMPRASRQSRKWRG